MYGTHNERMHAKSMYSPSELDGLGNLCVLVLATMADFVTNILYKLNE